MRRLPTQKPIELCVLGSLHYDMFIYYNKADYAFAYNASKKFGINA